ncbi:MAG TPA: FAD-binding oxidoreductase [Verrucomicrobiae bacterium]
MYFRPTTLEELRTALLSAAAEKRKLGPVAIDAFDRVLEHFPEDMTVTTQCGITLGNLQKQLAARGQWLPIDPPGASRLTIGGLLDHNLSGPRRFGYGTIREHLLGLTVMLASGEIIKSGGKVVKNVAGYDLQKLFVGGHGSLGVLLEATFKLRPLPEAEQFFATSFPNLQKAFEMLRSLNETGLTPIVVDLHNLASQEGAVSLVLGFAGTKEECAWQVEQLVKLNANWILTDLGYNESFSQADTQPYMRSVLPSALPEAIDDIKGARFVARAGNGCLYYRGGNPPITAAIPRDLNLRVKNTFDPNNIFPEPLI